MNFSTAQNRYLSPAQLGLMLQTSASLSLNNGLIIAKYCIMTVKESSGGLVNHLEAKIPCPIFHAIARSTKPVHCNGIAVLI